MIKIKRLELEGFRSFKELAIIDFPDSGLVLVSGRYSGSDISSGSGKSSILMAIAFALDICDLPATELKNWNSSKISVKLTLTDDSNNTIEVLKNPKLSLTINGTLYESLTTGAKEKLHSILKTSPDLLQALTYRPQRSTGKFINMTDSNMKDFLTEVLKLNEIEKAADQLDLEIKSIKDQTVRSESAILATQQTLGAYSVSDEQLLQAKKEYEQADLRLKQLQCSNSEAALEQNIKLLQGKLQEASSLMQKVKYAQQENQSLKTQIIATNEEIIRLKASICYTCNREWENSSNLMESKQIKLKEMIQKMETNISFCKNAEPILTTAERFQGELWQAQQEIGKLKAPASDAILAKSTAERNLRALMAMGDSHKSNLERLSQLKQQLEKDNGQLQILNYEAEILGRNGFLGSIFDEVIKEIEMRTNDMLKEIPNVSEFTVSISSTTTSKGGNSKKAISKRLFKNGKEIGVKSLSGGQQCSLELCADLAVAETIRARHGSQLGWIALDEAMDGLGNTEKQSALQMIKSKVNGLILIIDHSTEVKENFEKVIEIVYNGKESYVEQ